MQTSFINYLNCPTCKKSSFKVVAEKQNSVEIRRGYIWCTACKSKFTISKGVLNLLANPGPTVARAQQGSLNYDLLPNALPFRVEDAAGHEQELLSLPDGNNSVFFQKETLLRNIADAAYAFHQTLSLLGLRGSERLLDLGADICWSTNKFAELGCQCVALDINHHLPVSDVYINKNNVYFERIMADMSDLPFTDDSFDIVVNVTSMHHTPCLKKTFREIARVLKPAGKAVLINEPIRTIFAPKDFGSERSRKLGLNEHWYTALEYYSAARNAGLKLTFKLNIRPQISGEPTWKRIIRSFIHKHPQISKLTRIPVTILLFHQVYAVMVAHK